MKHDGSVNGALLTKDETRILSWSDDHDRETQRMILSSGSMAKLAELGDARSWMLWLKKQFQDADARAAEAMQTELARSKSLPAVGTKEKRRMRVVILTDSHSLRPKEFADWNANIDWIKRRSTEWTAAHGPVCDSVRRAFSRIGAMIRAAQTHAKPSINRCRESTSTVKRGGPSVAGDLTFPGPRLGGIATYGLSKIRLAAH
jgi:hypothetical protein